MYFKVAIEVILAAFSVFGLYTAVRILAQKVFGDKNIILAVVFESKKEAENAEMLIREAIGNFLATSSCRVAALVSEEFSNDEELMRIIRKYGLEYFII